MIESINKSMTLDLNNSSYKVVKTTSGNRHCRFLVITITKDEEDYTIPEGVEVIVRGHRSDGKTFFEETVISENEIILELNDNIVGKGGVSECELAFYYNKGEDEEQLLITMPFKIQAPESPFDETAVINSVQFSALEEAIITVQGLIENVSDLKEETTAILNSWDEYYKPHFDQAIVDEQQRTENEDSRVEAENSRVEAENTRVSNEDNRVVAENNRVVAENNRVSAENDRISAENDRVSAENTRVTAETNRISSEEARVTAENNRVSAEDARVIAENDRVSAENDRATAETERNDSEADRITAENERVSAENIRIENEKARVEAENARKEAETNRDTEESKRVSAETDRASAEAVRNSSEESRVNAENARDAAENIRVKNETDRIAAESARANAETDRITEESTRVANENERIENEAKRIEAEKSRETNTAEAIKNSEAATKKAEDAASGVIAALEGTIATVDHIGLSKPDGDTITIDKDGTLHSSAKGIEITLEEYNALSEEEKSDGSVYYITDADSISGETSSVTYTKSQITDFNQELSTEDLNSIKEPGYYFANAGNTVANKPTDVDAFGLEVIPSSNDWITQVLYVSELQKSYRRWVNESAITEWVEEHLSDTASKLTTARNISVAGDFTGSYSFDGSEDVSYNLWSYYSKSLTYSKNNYPWHRIAKLDTITDSYTDKAITLYLSQEYNNGYFGIVRVSLRTNDTGVASAVEVKWLVRSGFEADAIKVGLYNIYGSTYADVFLKSQNTYDSTIIRQMASGSRRSITRTWILVDSTENNGTTADDKLDSTECWKTIEEAATELHSQDYSTIINGTDSGMVSKSLTSETATKLSTSAGSATQPVYFQDGEPVACESVLGKTVIGTLSAGSTSITFSDSLITTDSTLDFYTSIYGVSPKTVSVASGSVTLTFKAQTTDVKVKVVIK